MALKQDMSKAYDRVECNFLEEMMRKLRFDRRWINLVMNCINFVSYSILINDEPHGRIILTIGLRHGDSISPYLFVICAKVLGAMLEKVERDGELIGCQLLEGGQNLNHLSFANDSLLFCKANVLEWCQLQQVLDTHEHVLGEVELEENIHFLQ